MEDGRAVGQRYGLDKIRQVSRERETERGGAPRKGGCWKTRRLEWSEGN